MSVEESRRLTERYGAPAPWRRRSGIAAAGLIVAAFLGWLAWTIADQTTPAVTSELETFSFEGEHAATAVLVVSLSDAQVQATCRLRAIAADHTVVGELSFTPDPGVGRRQVREIRTERRATAVTSLGCTAPGQNRGR